MQEKINQRRVISLSVLIVLTALAYIFISRKDEQEAVDKGLFKTESLKSINRVELMSTSDTVNLTFSGSRWMVNDKFIADGSLIEVLFATLQQAEPKRPVATALEDSIASELKRNGVKVSLFEGQSLKRTFYAGGNRSKTQAYFFDPNTEQAYVMVIPGYRVYVSGIFELSTNGFRDKYVFNFNWRNFKSLEVDFPMDPKANFSVAMEDGLFQVVGLNETDTARLNTYLDNVSLLTVDEFASQSIDSLATQTPVMTIVIKDAANRTYQLEVLSDYSQGTAVRVNGDLAFIDPRRIKPILRKKSFFAKE